MANKKFVRRNTTQYLKLGKRRKKIRKWRRPKGRHSKMREKKKGYPAVVSIGYKKSEKARNISYNKINNIKDISNIKNGESILLGRIGKRKKLSILKLVKEKNIKILNFKEKITKERKNETG